MRSESSRTEIDLSSSIHSWVLVAMSLFLRGGLVGGSAAFLGGGGRPAARAGAPPTSPVGDRLELAGEPAYQAAERGREAGERRSDDADEAA